MTRPIAALTAALALGTVYAAWHAGLIAGAKQVAAPTSWTYAACTLEGVEVSRDLKPVQHYRCAGRDVFLELKAR